MAHFASGALLSGPINVLVERLAPDAAIMEFFRGKKDVVGLLRELKSRLLSVSVVLNDAEEKQFTNPDVKAWLDEITNVISKTELLMDKIGTEDLGRKMGNESATAFCKFLKIFSSSVPVFEKDVIVELQEILEELNLLSGQKDKLGLKLGLQNKPLQRSLSPLLVKESDVYGRDEDKEKLFEMLFSDVATGPKLSVVAIVGMAGIGKTTLARLVYGDKMVQKHFELKAWVTVSVDFDVFQITKTIFGEVTGENCNIRKELELQSKLNEALAGKKFLLVLDDLWNENYLLWDGLMSGFGSVASGSRIIATTRSKVVAFTMGSVEVHELQLVSDEDCWQMFANDVFKDDVNSKPRTELLQEVGLEIVKCDDVDSKPQTELLQEVGLDIVKRCKGLPLAVKSLAGLLRSTSNPEEWKKILNSDIWQLQSQMNLKDNVLPALWLSYQYLPPHLKRCFAYCSIFPKDYQFDEIDTKNLMLVWMAEGLIQPEEGKRMEDVGKEYLDALIARSFFQHSSKRKSAVVMHDLVHDLAMFISGEYCFAYGDCNDSRYLGTKSCHLSYRKESDDLTKLASLSQTTSLRTLLALPLSSSYPKKQRILKKELLYELFQKVGGSLKVLSLSESAVQELPRSIGNLKYLRYLNLSSTTVVRLPDSICKLLNLQSLLLSGCTELKELPSRITALVSLRHLDITGTPLAEMPPQICKLKNLRTLSDFVLGDNGGGRIKELREFPLLGGSLCISGLENIVEVRDVLEANLKDKKFLSELILKWHGDSNITSTQLYRGVLEALQPHTNLEVLRISGYRGTIFPDWVGHESFCNMVALELCYCRNVCMLPPLGQLPSLRRLTMYNLDGVISIGDEFCGSSSPTTNHPFTSLEHLEFMRMISWEEWSFCSDRLGQEGGVFPSLKNLEISGCNKLVAGLPDCYLPSLERIYIVHCEEMVHVCPITTQEMDMNAFPSLQFLFVQNCPRLETLCFSSTLKVLGISYCKKLWQNPMNWDHLQRLSSLESLHLGGIEVWDLFPEKEGLLPTTLTELSIHDFENLKGLNSRAFQHLISLQQLEISRCYRLECLPEEGLPPFLSYLRIYNCPLLKQRCQRGTGEDWPKIAHIPHIIIDDQESASTSSKFSNFIRSVLK